MGCSPFKRCMTSCSTNRRAIAPNPDPSRWSLIDVKQFRNAYVLVVEYAGCTNFEGRKVMVYEGKWDVTKRGPLDPHFAEDGGPVARFRPTPRGMDMAIDLASKL